MITPLHFIKKLVLAFFILSYLFLSSKTSRAQTVTVAGLNSGQNGITQGSLILGQKNIVLFGFEVKVQGTTSISEINLDVNSPDNKNNYFSNFRLYKSADHIFSADDPLVKATATFKKNNISGLSLSGLTENFNAAAGTTRTYFLLADYTNTWGEVPGRISFGFSRKQKQDALVTGKKGFNSFDVQGKDFTISSSEITLSSLNSPEHGISEALLPYGQKDVVVFGFGVNVKGVSVIDELNLTASNNIENFFSNARLYRSSDKVFSANDVLVSRASGRNKGNSNNKGKGNHSDNFLSFSDLAESYNWSPEQYYFVVANYDVNEAKDQQSIQFKISEGQDLEALIQAEPEGKAFNNFNINGQIFKFIRSAHWVGNNPTDPTNWNNPGNWSGNYVPGPDDVAYIGLQNFTNQPVVTSNTTVGKIVLGASKPVVLRVDSSFTLSSNEIILTSADASVSDTLMGKGSIKTNLLQINDNNSLISYSTLRSSRLVSAISDLNINNLVLLSKSNSNLSNAALEVAGKLSVSGKIQSINQSSANESSLTGLSGSTIELSGAEPFNLSASGSTPIRSEGLVRYSSSASQIVEPFVTYKDLELAGAGIKTVKATNPNIFYLAGSLTITSPAAIAYAEDITAINIRGDIKGDAALNSGELPVTIGGNWVNTFADTVPSLVWYDGTGDQLVAPLAYRNVKFSNGGIKTLRGAASVKESVEVSPATIFNTADKLSLLADSTSFAIVKPLLGGADIQGKATIQSYIKGGTRGYLSLSAPVYDTLSINKQVRAFTYIQLKKFMPLTGNGGPVNGFDEGAIANPSGATVRLYREQSSPTQAQYTFPLRARDTISSGRGFFFFFRGNRNNIYNKVNPPFLAPESVLMEYTGFVNRGTINVPISFTNFRNEGDDGFNLVGNPYPATIDLHKLFAGTPYSKIWIQTLNGGYAVYDLNLQTGTNGASRYIIPSQGFYIQAKAPGVLTFTEECKIDGEVRAGRIMSAPGGSNAATLSSLGLGRKSEYVKIQVGTAGASDETMIVFKEGSSSKVTDEDAIAFTDAKKIVSSLSSDSSSLAINYLPVEEKDQTVKIWISGEENAQYSLKLSKNTLSSYPAILLKDNHLNKVIDIKNGNVYNFTVDKAISSSFGTERFELLFKQTASTTVAALTAASIVIYPNPASSDITVKLVDNSYPVRIRIYNSAGALVKKSSFTAGSAIHQYIGDLASGVYFIEISNASNNKVLHREKFLRN